jgi:hypothetical protein
MKNLNKLQVLKAKKSFNNTMKATYPNFTEKKWGMTSYRKQHPQQPIS